MWGSNFPRKKTQRKTTNRKKLIKENNDSDSASETLPHLDDKI